MIYKPQKSLVKENNIVQSQQEISPMYPFKKVLVLFLENANDLSISNRKLKEFLVFLIVWIAIMLTILSLGFELYSFINRWKTINTPPSFNEIEDAEIKLDNIII